MKIAIITGASSGLGQELAYLLDKKETLDEIWLIARSEETMKKMQSSMKTSVRVLAYDLTKDVSLHILQNIIQTENPAIKFFINAAGFAKIGRYNNISLTACAAMIDLNCRSSVLLTQIVIPYMPPNSHIMEVCSTAAFQPLPYINIYAASKTFLYHYSRALNNELHSCNISVTAVCPYWIKDTNFIKTAVKTPNSSYIKNFYFASHKKTIAKKALKDMINNKAVSTPGIICTLHHFAAKFIPYEIMMCLWNFIRKF
ncbi:SDR family NAD(P)-dependent oxidoreductase [Pectinatus sottacetonis]|uniref:SDR family NAD(P)-dependent oxidoreductase n=1 Tax=Pectinatus sottacetonis TaxID=1002795 RepID=UPI0018C5868D|nr:SDR family NAD(P)-dependent oxidoreductase [Pectinatus sottacetonis]